MAWGSRRDETDGRREEKRRAHRGVRCEVWVGTSARQPAASPAFGRRCSSCQALRLRLRALTGGRGSTLAHRRIGRIGPRGAIRQYEGIRNALCSAGGPYSAIIAPRVLVAPVCPAAPVLASSRQASGTPDAGQAPRRAHGYHGNLQGVALRCAQLAIDASPFPIRALSCLILGRHVWTSRSRSRCCPRSTAPPDAALAPLYRD